MKNDQLDAIIRRRYGKCSECGRQIFTIDNTPTSAPGIPVLCRKCFGETTYNRRSHNPLIEGSGNIQADIAAELGVS